MASFGPAGIEVRGLVRRAGLAAAVQDMAAGGQVRLGPAAPPATIADADGLNLRSKRLVRDK